MSFPAERPRRLRRTPSLRALVRETRLAPTDFVLPLFAMPGEGVRNEVASMPGVFQTSVDELVKDARAAFEVGLRSVILFGLPPTKDALGASGWDETGPVQRAVRALKDTLPDLVKITTQYATIRTAHALVGSCLLATAVVIALRLRRPMRHAIATPDRTGSRWAELDRFESRGAAIVSGVQGEVP